MTDPDPDRLTELRELGRSVASTSHEEIASQTLDSLGEFADEVTSHLEAEERVPGGRKLLAFWESFVETKLEATGEDAEAIAEDTIDRFEQAFDEDLIGVDLYQALETLAIVDQMPPGETDEDRLGQWAARVHSLTEEFLAHLKSHSED